MLHIGCHLSSSKGFAAMGRQALELGADTFQFFTRNPPENHSESQVWIRGDYDRSQRKYECKRFDDANKFCYLDGDREVYTEPTF